MAALNDVLSAAQALSQEDLRALSDRILGLLNIPNNENAPEAKCDCCRRCSSDKIVKYGKDKNGKQRYKCKSCNTVFYADSFSVTSRTHTDPQTWRTYVDLLLNRASLKKCAIVCKISVQTAFTWRHKILSVLQKDQENRMLGGIVEADETFFGISYKGNHSKSKKFTMPRRPYKRGTDSREQTGSRACVMCAFERNGQTYVEVLGKGQPTIGMLSHAFGNRLMPETIFITDKAIGMKNYFKDNKSIQLIQLKAHIKPKSMNSPPEVRGAFHINNINNMHYRLRNALKPYCGVSTKYLNHYVNLFAWIENHKNISDFDFNRELCLTLHEQNGYLPLSNIVSLPPIPVVA